MRPRLLPRPQSFQVSDGSVALYIKVLLEDDDLFVNLGTDPQFCSAQFGDTHYAILDHQTLYQEAGPAGGHRHCPGARVVVRNSYR